MPDFKFWTRESARRLAKAKDYPERAREAIIEMHRQVGPLRFSPDGLARRGLLVRHLSFENDTFPTGKRLQFSIAHMLSGMLAVSLALAVSRWLAATQGRFSDIGTLATFVILWAFLCGSISLTSLWACLALGPVWSRLLFVLAFPVLGGPLVAFALGIELTRGLLLSVGLFVVTTIVNVTLLAVPRIQNPQKRLAQSSPSERTGAV